MSADTFMAALGLPETYAVGGSVRDELLGRPTKDSDYLVRGTPLAEICRVVTAAGAAASGLKLRDGRVIGVRAAIRGLGLIEIVLPRKEVSTGGGHRDFQIVCDPSIPLAEDATRRDFTINALYRDVRTGSVADPLGVGREDLERQRIRTTHPNSFRDDPLRTLRGLRFVSTLGFQLDESTYREMQAHAEHVTALTLKGVSGAALSELQGLLMGARPSAALGLMRDSGVLAVLLPELASMIGFHQQSAYHDKLCDEHTFDAVQAAADHGASLRVRMALLFHDAGKPWMAWTADGRKHYYAIPQETIRQLGAPPTAIHSHEWWGAFLASEALERLNAPAALRRDVTTLIERHMLSLQGRVKPFKVRTWRMELGDSLLADLLIHRRADVLGKGGDTSSALAHLDRIEQTQQRAITDGVPCSTKGLAVSGADLVSLGLKGPDVGAVQRQLLREVIAEPSLNNGEWLLQRAAALA